MVLVELSIQDYKALKEMDGVIKKILARYEAKMKTKNRGKDVVDFSVDYQQVWRQERNPREKVKWMIEAVKEWKEKAVQGEKPENREWFKRAGGIVDCVHRCYGDDVDHFCTDHPKLSVKSFFEQPCANGIKHKRGIVK